MIILLDAESFLNMSLECWEGNYEYNKGMVVIDVFFSSESGFKFIFNTKQKLNPASIILNSNQYSSMILYTKSC